MKKILPNNGDQTKKLQSTFSHPLLKWYQKNKRDLPWRKTKDPYAILVSEIMLQQTQVKTVIPYYERWMKLFPNARTLARAPLNKVLKAWEGLGYYRRARLLHSAAKHIISKYKGQFPQSVENISELPGVGPYTLGAVGSIAFNLPLPILDGNVIRVLCRWLGIRGNPNESITRKKLWAIAENAIPKTENSSSQLETRNLKLETFPTAGDFNQSMMELGALICVPQKPLCLLCPIQRNCWAYKNNAQSELPNLPPRPSSIRQYEYAGLVIQNDKVLLHQRGEGRMEDLWQLPSIVLAKRSKNWEASWKKTFGSFDSAKNITTSKYTITNHQIHLQLIKIGGLKDISISGNRWIKLSRARELPYTAAHRKLVDQFLFRTGISIAS